MNENKPVAEAFDPKPYNKENRIYDDIRADINVHKALQTQLPADIESLLTTTTLADSQAAKSLLLLRTRLELLPQKIEQLDKKLDAQYAVITEKNRELDLILQGHERAFEKSLKQALAGVLKPYKTFESDVPDLENWAEQCPALHWADNVMSGWRRYPYENVKMRRALKALELISSGSNFYTALRNSD